MLPADFHATGGDAEYAETSTGFSVPADREPGR